MSSADHSLGNVIQQASAGTGKTYALSNRYLELVARGVDPETILATTFTRKGSGEILDRIVQRLGKAATSDEQAAELADALKLRIDREQSAKLLRRMMDQLPHLQIGTLDSFFNRVARAYCFELRLPTAWAIVDSVRENSLRERAIQTVLSQQQAIQLLRLMSKTDADRRIADAAFDLVNDLYEKFRDSTQAAWSLMSHVVPVSLREAARVVAEAGEMSGLTDNQITEVEKIKAAIQAGAWDELPEKTLLHKVLDGDLKYRNQAIPQSLRDWCIKVLDLCRRQIQYLVAQRTAATWGILALIAAELQPLQVQRGELQFSDVTYHLSRSIQLKAESLSARMGQRIDHLLLDEFQDTSPQQWAIISPIAQHVTELNSNRSFFCVGDKKQAIYAWRGGVAEIFDAAHEFLGGRVSEAPQLVQSRRSCPAIIETVNQVFSNITRTHVANDYEREVFKNWQMAFPQHTTVHVAMPGCVSVERAACTPETVKLDSDTIKECVVAATVAEVQRLHQSIPNGTIAVLARGNEPIADIAFRLQRLKIPTSEEAGNPPTDSAAVELVLSAMTLADHPSDGVARYHLAHSPLAMRYGLAPEERKNQLENQRIAHAASAKIRHELLHSGYGPTIYRIARDLTTHCTNRELSRLEQLVEMAFAYDSSWTLRPQRFVDFVRQQRVLDPTGARVRLMTVHASKGLEFDIVVAPMFNFQNKWASKTPSVVAGRSDPGKPIDAICRYVDKDSRRMLPDAIQNTFEEHSSALVNEELCVLYVMMTRAIHQLSVIVPPRAKNDQSNPVGVLLATLNTSSDESENLIFETGNSNWSQSITGHADTAESRDAIKAGPADSVAKAILPVRLAVGARTGRGMDWTKPSGGDETKRLAPLRDLWQSGERHEAIERGIYFHACLRHVEWLDDPPEDRVLQATLAGMAVGSKQSIETIRDFRQLCELSVLRQWLTRETYLNGLMARRFPASRPLLEPIRLDVQNERRFVIQHETKMLEGGIDRLVLIFEGDRLVAADIFDFKTGGSSDRVDSRNLTGYRSQLGQYRAMSAKFLRLDPKQIGGFLLFVDRDAVVSIDDLD